MKYEEMKSLSREELIKKHAELKRKHFDIKMKNALGQASNPLEIRSLRRSIARVLTAKNKIKGK